MKSSTGFFLCAILGVVVYLNTLPNPFIYDDVFYVQKNPLVRSLGTLPRTFVTPFSPYAPGLYRPVTVASYAVDHAIFGLDPRGFHVGNILLHAIASGLLFLLAFQLLGAFAPALIAGLLFAVHPVHTEAVAWVSGRSEILAGIFVFGSALLFLRSRFVLSAVAYLLALFAKEIAAPLPVVLFLLGRFKPREKRLKKKQWAAFVGSFGFSFLFYLCFRLVALGGLTVPTELSRTGSLSLPERLWRLPPVLAHYLRLMVWPTGLRIEYDWVTFSWLMTAASTIAIVVLLAIGVWSWRRAHSNAPLQFAAMGIVWFFLFLTPVMNIIPIGEFIAERFLYVASAGVCLVVGALLLYVGKGAWPASTPKGAPIQGKVTAGKQRAPTNARGYKKYLLLFFFILFIFSILTIRRNADWRDPKTLWRSTLQLSPNAPHAMQNLTALLLAKGKLEEALELSQHAREQWPQKPMLHVLAGKIYGELSRPDLQRSAYERALMLAMPNDIEFTDFQRGTVLVELARFDEALPVLQRALERNPFDPSVLNNLSISQAQTGNVEEAKQSFERAIVLFEEMNERSAEEERNYRGAIENLRLLSEV